MLASYRAATEHPFGRFASPSIAWPNDSRTGRRSRWGNRPVNRHEGMATSISAEGPTTWHICWQAALGRDLLVDAAMADRIRWRLIQAHDKPGRALVDYLLVPSEIH